tara:strand:+ start:4353 stop:5963 length:1611 start_codon:yes stop_codon:yes gene_type:complete
MPSNIEIRESKLKTLTVPDLKKIVVRNKLAKISGLKKKQLIEILMASDVDISQEVSSKKSRTVTPARKKQLQESLSIARSKKPKSIKPPRPPGNLRTPAGQKRKPLETCPPNRNNANVNLKTLVGQGRESGKECPKKPIPIPGGKVVVPQDKLRIIKDKLRKKKQEQESKESKTKTERVPEPVPKPVPQTAEELIEEFKKMEDELSDIEEEIPQEVLEDIDDEIERLLREAIGDDVYEEYKKTKEKENPTTKPPLAPKKPKTKPKTKPVLKPVPEPDPEPEEETSIQDFIDELMASTGKTQDDILDLLESNKRKFNKELLLEFTLKHFDEFDLPFTSTRSSIKMAQGLIDAINNGSFAIDQDYSPSEIATMWGELSRAVSTIEVKTQKKQPKQPKTKSKKQKKESETEPNLEELRTVKVHRLPEEEIPKTAGEAFKQVMADIALDNKIRKKLKDGSDFDNKIIAQFLRANHFAFKEEDLIQVINYLLPSNEVENIQGNYALFMARSIELDDGLIDFERDMDKKGRRGIVKYLRDGI